MSNEYDFLQEQKIKIMKNNFLKENAELVELLQNIESELYHLCKFNVDTYSKTLIPLRKYMKEKGIEQKD